MGIGESREVSMTAERSNTIRKQRWIMEAGWVPHWKFACWKLKFLDDPKGIFDGKGEIHTIVRQGLKDDMPDVYQFLDNYNWAPEDLEQLKIRSCIRVKRPCAICVNTRIRYNPS